MDRKIDSAGVMMGIIASYTDGVGGSSSKVFPRVLDSLKWLCQMQAQDTHIANPVPSLRILSCKTFQANSSNLCAACARFLIFRPCHPLTVA